MTILSVIQRASTEIAIQRPTAVFSSTERELLEAQDVANEMAEEIAAAHSWQALKRLHTFTGNGTADAFDLPTGYERMPKDQRLWTSRLPEHPLYHVVSHDEWLDLITREYQTVTGSWTILGNQMAFYPVLSSGETVKFYYISNLIVEDAAGATKTAFTADDDEFRLPERLLRLGFVLQWKRKKGLPFDDRPFFNALDQEIARDAGARDIRIGRPRYDGELAYPISIITG